MITHNPQSNGDIVLGASEVDRDGAHEGEQALGCARVGGIGGETGNEGVALAESVDDLANDDGFGGCRVGFGIAHEGGYHCEAGLVAVVARG